MLDKVIAKDFVTVQYLRRKILYLLSTLVVIF